MNNLYARIDPQCRFVTNRGRNLRLEESWEKGRSTLTSLSALCCHLAMLESQVTPKGRGMKTIENQPEVDMDLVTIIPEPTKEFIPEKEAKVKIPKKRGRKKKPQKGKKKKIVDPTAPRRGGPGRGKKGKRKLDEGMSGEKPNEREGSKGEGKEEENNRDKSELGEKEGEEEEQNKDEDYEDEGETEEEDQEGADDDNEEGESGSEEEDKEKEKEKEKKGSHKGSKNENDDDDDDETADYRLPGSIKRAEAKENSKEEIDSPKKRKGKPAKTDGDFMDSEEFCELCFQDGELLKCSFCDLRCHLYCLPVPLKRPPRGEWKCPSCEKKSERYFKKASRNSSEPPSLRPSRTNRGKN